MPVTFNPLIIHQSQNLNNISLPIPSFTYELSKNVFIGEECSDRMLAFLFVPTEIVDTLMTLGRSLAYPSYYCIAKINDEWEGSSTCKKAGLFIGGVFLEITALVATPILFAIQAIISVGHLLKGFLITFIGLSFPHSKPFVFFADLPDYYLSSLRKSQESVKDTNSTSLFSEANQGKPADTDMAAVNEDNTKQKRHSEILKRQTIRLFTDFQVSTQNDFSKWANELIYGRTEIGLSYHIDYQTYSTTLDPHKGILIPIQNGDTEAINTILNTEARNIDFKFEPKYISYRVELQSPFFTKPFVDQLVFLLKTGLIEAVKLNKGSLQTSVKEGAVKKWIDAISYICSFTKFPLSTSEASELNIFFNTELIKLEIQVVSEE